MGFADNVRKRIIDLGTDAAALMDTIDAAITVNDGDITTNTAAITAAKDRLFSSTHSTIVNTASTSDAAIHTGATVTGIDTGDVVEAIAVINVSASNSADRWQLKIEVDGTPIAFDYYSAEIDTSAAGNTIPIVLFGKHVVSGSSNIVVGPVWRAHVASAGALYSLKADCYVQVKKGS